MYTSMCMHTIFICDSGEDIHSADEERDEDLPNRSHGETNTEREQQEDKSYTRRNDQASSECIHYNTLVYGAYVNVYGVLCDWYVYVVMNSVVDESMSRADELWIELHILARFSPLSPLSPVI